jgi:hypothetical protein
MRSRRLQPELGTRLRHRAAYPSNLDSIFDAASPLKDRIDPIRLTSDNILPITFNDLGVENVPRDLFRFFWLIDNVRITQVRGI